jgi:hypothetical protein
MVAYMLITIKYHYSHWLIPKQVTISPLKPKLMQITGLCKHPVPTAKKTEHVSVTKIIWFLLFRKIIAVYSENQTKPINALCGQNAELLNVKAGGTLVTTSF